MLTFRFGDSAVKAWMSVEPVKSHVPSLSACQEGSADPMNRNASESIRSSDNERGA